MTLRIAHLSKARPDSPSGAERQVGYFSYPVRDFEWVEMHPGKHFVLDLRDLERDGFHAVFHEDGGVWGDYTHRVIPVLYYAVDSTVTLEHYLARRTQAAKSDMILVDHDRLVRFKDVGSQHIPVHRFSYCTNDRVFYPREKMVDIAFHMATGKLNHNRAVLRDRLELYAKAKGYSIRIGGLPPKEYAESLGAARVVINLPQVPENRPHRVFDAMASGAALLTAPLPFVSGEDYRAGEEFAQFHSLDECYATIDRLLSGQWVSHAEAGYRWIVNGHTWQKRARQLAALIREVL